MDSPPQVTLPDPLTLLNSSLWSKEGWKVLTKTAIAAYYEATWHQKADRNSKLKFLNVQTTGLAGRPHPVLLGVLTTQEVMRSRVNVKMLAGDYPCYSYLGSDRNLDAFCRLIDVETKR